MSNYIPLFFQRSQLLQDALYAAYAISGSRTKRSIKNMPFSKVSWGPAHDAAYQDLQNQLREAVRLAHQDPDKALCLYTDANENFWSAVVTQCDKTELDKPVAEQRHEPLAFLGSKFKGSALHWSTYEKEGFAVYKAFKSLDYLFAMEEGTFFFTDHRRNLLFCYKPLALDSTLGKHVVGKVQRWAIYLARFGYFIGHINGDENVFADIMTRWMSEGPETRLSIRRLIDLVLLQDMVQSPLSDEFVWPELSACETDEQDRVIIPDSNSELQLKLLVIAHCGASGHRGFESTYNMLKEKCHWRGMKNDCKEFTPICIHCLSAKGGLRISRPLSSTLHGSLPNEVSHFDYLYMGSSTAGFKYLLVIKDDLGAYVWLMPTMAADAVSTAEELSKWIRAFSAPKWWVSDQASHFKNEVIDMLANDHRITHSFTVAYSAWVNETVENLMKHILVACRALLSELHFAPMKWPEVIGVIMQALNEAPTERLRKRDDGIFRSPLEVMTGIKPRRMDTLTVVRADKVHRLTMDRTKAEELLCIDTLQSALQEMHKEVSSLVSTKRAENIARHNAKTHVVTPNFNIGDFVLVRRAQNKGHKLAFRWLGPRRITKTLGETVFEVSGILDGKVETAHSARLLLYRGDLDGKPISDHLAEHIQHSEARYDLVEQLLDIGEDANDGLFVQVQWLGLPDKCVVAGHS